MERGLRAAGHDVRFVPADFRRFRKIAEALHPRVMATAAAPPDESGQMSLSLHAGAWVDELHNAGRDPERLLIVEVNFALPRILGIPPKFPHALSVEEADRRLVNPALSRSASGAVDVGWHGLFQVVRFDELGAAHSVPRCVAHGG